MLGKRPQAQVQRVAFESTLPAMSSHSNSARFKSLSAATRHHGLSVCSIHSRREAIRSAKLFTALAHGAQVGSILLANPTTLSTPTPSSAQSTERPKTI